MDNSWVLAIVLTLIASSGFWSIIQIFINNHIEKKSDMAKMILGLGHDRIVQSCQTYIDRGYITINEYDDLHNYLYKPYTKLGGNGSAKKMIEEVERLPFRPNEITGKEKENE